MVVNERVDAWAWPSLWPEQKPDFWEWSLNDNKLTSVPAEIGQLTALRELNLNNNKLTSVPAEIGQLTSLTVLYINGNQLTSLPAEIATREFPLANSHRHS